LRNYRQLLSNADINEVYYAHDFVSDIPQLTMNAFPNALRVTYGDALGTTVNPDYYQARLTGKSRAEATAVARAAAKNPVNTAIRSPKQVISNLVQGRMRSLKAEVAALVLPVDQGGDFLRGKKLIVVPRNLALEVIRDLEHGLPELVDYSREVLAGTPAPHFVLLTENWTEAGILSPERAVGMYEELLRRSVPAGATVLIKAHPLAVEPLAERLMGQVRGTYHVTVIPDDIARYPLELWRTLLSSCQVLGVMSYTSISLRYLYGTEPGDLGAELIEQFAPEGIGDRFVEAEEMYSHILRQLGTWDQASVLWKGSP